MKEGVWGEELVVKVLQKKTGGLRGAERAEGEEGRHSRIEETLNMTEKTGGVFSDRLSRLK